MLCKHLGRRWKLLSRVRVIVTKVWIDANGRTLIVCSCCPTPFICLLWFDLSYRVMFFLSYSWWDLQGHFLFHTSIHLFLLHSKLIYITFKNKTKQNNNQKKGHLDYFLHWKLSKSFFFLFYLFYNVLHFHNQNRENLLANCLKLLFQTVLCKVASYKRQVQCRMSLHKLKAAFIYIS